MLLFVSTPVDAALNAGTLIKGGLPAVYYFAQDGKRYVFPNEKTYATWYSGFDSVEVVTDAELAALPIGGNVTYRPGVKLVKITTDPRTYAVSAGGMLRWVQTEEIARGLYGINWNTQVDDVADTYFVNYKSGTPISNANEYSIANELAITTSINQDKNFVQAIISTPIPAPTPEPTPVPTPTQPITPPVETCTSPACAEQRVPLAFSTQDSLISTSLGLGLGETWSFGGNRYVRIEDIWTAGWTGGAIVTVWTKDTKGCRLFTTLNAVALVDKGVLIFGDTALLYKFENNKVYFDAYQGSSATAVCMQFSTQPKLDCATLPNSSSLSLQDNRFQIFFKNADYTPAESVLLDLQSARYARLSRLFPSIDTGYSPNAQWRITHVLPSEMPLDASGLTISGTFISTIDVGAMQDLSTNLALYQETRTKITTNEFDRLFYQNQDLHEMGHAQFWSTQGQPTTGDYAKMISEGRANLFQILANWGEEDARSTMQRYCGETTYAFEGGESRSYAENYNVDGYAVGQCFHLQAWDTCGTAGINNAFAELLDQPYHPRDLYQTYFGIIDKHCANKARYRQILTNYGISASYLTDQAPLVSGLRAEDACSP